jgi:hypothetical protein
MVLESSPGKLVKTKSKFIHLYTWHRVNSISCTNTSQAKAKAAESGFLRSRLALGIEVVVMEMVSSKFYLLKTLCWSYMGREVSEGLSIQDLE